tara:strand:+ start:1301 stop:1714 length:414 start_codon:yes stop_codon:yes gene_type:complete
VFNLQNEECAVKLEYMELILITLYFLYGSLFLYSYFNDVGFLKYLYKKTNINKVIAIELVFIVIASFIVFTSQPLNWMVALIMIFHVFGIVWLVAFPGSFYEIYDQSMNVDPGSTESMTGWILIAFGVFVYFSRLII